MSDRLIYTIGPSGAGKDSVLTWLGQHLPTYSAVHFARRVIDRPVLSNGETHESLSTADFIAQRNQLAFALHWTANMSAPLCRTSIWFCHLHRQTHE